MFDELLHWLGIAKERIENPEKVNGLGNQEREVWALKKAMAILLIIDKFGGQAFKEKEAEPKSRE